MKIKIFKFITDGGDGEHHASIYPSKEVGFKAEEIEDDGTAGPYFDKYDYPVEVSEEILDITDFEVVT